MRRPASRRSRARKAEAPTPTARERLALSLLDAIAGTPTPRVEVARFQLTEAQHNHLTELRIFNAVVRVEQFGNEFVVFAFPLPPLLK